MGHVLTEKLCRSLPAPTKQAHVTYYDTRVRGLGVRVGRRGRVFVVKLSGGSTRRIAAIEDMRLDEARRYVEGLRSSAVRDRLGMGSSITLREAVALHIERLKRREKGFSQRSIADIEDRLRVHASDWMDKPLASITAQDCERRHNKIGKAHPVTANRVLRIMRAVYNSGVKSGRKLPPNPCSGLAWFPQRPSREVVTDLRAFWRSIQHLTPIRRDFYLLVLFTGLRNRDACSIAWRDVDLQTGTIYRPKPKGGERRAFTLPLSAVAKAILRRRKRRNERDFPDPSPWVFPAFSKSGHITEPKEEGVATPHSLRRTFATAAHAVGVDGWTIGVLLNHRPPSGSVTAGYVMPNVETLRKAVDSIGAELLRQLRAVRPYPGHG